MPILQSRLKLLIDAATKRESQLHNLVRELKILYNNGKQGQDIVNDLGIQIQLTEALLEPNAAIAVEQKHYQLTHNRNVSRRERLRQKRAQYREEHPLTAPKSRDSGYNDSKHQAQMDSIFGLANPSPEIPAKPIRKTIEEKYNEIMAVTKNGAALRQYYKDKYKDDWESYLPGRPNYNPAEDDEDYEPEQENAAKA